MMSIRLTKVWDALVYGSYALLIGTSFVTLIMPQKNSLDLHLVLGYSTTLLLIINILLSTLSVFSRNKYDSLNECHNNSNAFLHKTLVLLILAAVILTIFTGMIALAYSAQFGPLYSVIDYFPYWVFVTVNDLHEFSAYTFLALFLIAIVSRFIEHYLVKISASHSISVIRKDH